MENSQIRSNQYWKCGEKKMKLVLISTQKNFKEDLQKNFSRRGYSLIHYTNPMKAMDNYNEIDPDIILFSVSDFPRHWKIALKMIRETKNKEEAPFILLTSKDFDHEEAAKGLFLGANALLSVNERLDNENCDRLNKLILRYKKPIRPLKEESIIPQKDQPVHLMFTNPNNFQIVKGQFTDISLNGGGFKPDELRKTVNISPQTILKSCSLKVLKQIVTIDATVMENNGIMDLQFLPLENKTREFLKESVIG